MSTEAGSYVPEWNYSIVGAKCGKTVMLLQTLPNGTRVSADIPLLELSWSDADAVGRAIMEALKNKHVRLDDLEVAEIRLKSLLNQQATLGRETEKTTAKIKRTQEEIARLKKCQ